MKKDSKVMWLVSYAKYKNRGYGVKRLLEEGKKIGLNIKFIAIEQVKIIIKNGKSEIYIKEKKMKLPDIALSRNDVSYKMMLLVDILEKSGVKIFNKNYSRILSKDKYNSLQELSYNNIPIPNTIILESDTSIEFIKKNFNFPVIIKRNRGTHGKGIIKINNEHDLSDNLEMIKENIDLLSREYLLQEFVGEKFGHDIRVFVVGGKVIGSMLRKGKEGSFKSNFSVGGEAFDYKLNKIEKKLALDTVKTIGLDIAGVDILFDKNNQYKICEINASPGFKGLEKATGLNIAKMIVEYLFGIK